MNRNPVALGIRVEQRNGMHRWRVLDFFGAVVDESGFRYQTQFAATKDARRRRAVLIRLRGKVERVRNGKVEK